MALTTIYRGQTVKGTLNLRVTDSCVPGLKNPYAIPGGATIVINFPGATSTVSLSTATMGEITIVDSALSTISFEMSATKSALLAITSSGAIDVKVTSGSNVDIFEKAVVLKIADIANP
jgi:hypothetical protein